MLLLSDTDIILKLCALNLVEEGINAIGVSHDSIYTLTATKYVIGSRRVRTKYSETTLKAAIAFVETTIPLTEEHDTHLISDKISSTPHIDAGEAQLFAGGIVRPKAIVATDDKRSLESLSQAPGLQEECAKLNGRIITLLQVIDRILDEYEFGDVLERVIPARDCDTALRAVFGSGYKCNEKRVRASIQSYIASLRKQTGELLTP